MWQQVLLLKLTNKRINKTTGRSNTTLHLVDWMFNAHACCNKKRRRYCQMVNTCAMCVLRLASAHNACQRTLHNNMCVGLLEISTRLGKINALLDRAGELRHAFLQGILLICAETAGKVVHLLNTCSRLCHECCRQEGYLPRINAHMIRSLH